MSAITRHRDASYHVGQGREPIDLDGYLEATKDACSGTCNRDFRFTNAKALSELRLAYITREERVPYIADERTVTRALATVVHRQVSWCQDCDDEIRSAVGGLPALASKCRRIGGESGRLAPTPPSEVHVMAIAAPSPSPAFDMCDLIWRWPSKWGQMLGSHLDQPIGPDVSFDWLIGHWSALMAAPFAVEFGKDALALYRRAELAAGADSLVHHLPAPCMHCDRKALTRTDGKERVTCGYCHRWWKWEDYERLAVAYRESGASEPVRNRKVLGHSNEGYGGAA